MKIVAAVLSFFIGCNFSFDMDTKNFLFSFIFMWSDVTLASHHLRHHMHGRLDNAPHVPSQKVH